MILETIFPQHKKHVSHTAIFYFSIAALAAAMTYTFFDFSKTLILYNSFIRVNMLTGVLNMTMIGGIFITVLASKNYLEQENINYGEYYSLMFFSLLGMMLMNQANDLI